MAFTVAPDSLQRGRKTTIQEWPSNSFRKLYWDCWFTVVVCSSQYFNSLVSAKLSHHPSLSFGHLLLNLWPPRIFQVCTSWGFWSNSWLSSSFNSPHPAMAFTSQIFHHSSSLATYSVRTTKLKPVCIQPSPGPVFLHLFPIQGEKQAPESNLFFFYPTSGTSNRHLSVQIFYLISLSGPY